MSGKKFFTKEEAEKEVGKEIVTEKPFFDIPVGTIGLVTEAALTVSGYCVSIQWQDEEKREISVSKDEYEDLMEENMKILKYDKESAFTMDSGK